MRGPQDAGRRLWTALIVAAAVFAAWESARYTLAGGRRGRFHVEGPYFIMVGLAVLLVLLFSRRRKESARVGPVGRLERSAWVLVACTAWALLLYWPSLTLGFLSDDFVLVDRAQRGHALDLAPGGFWRPLPHWVLGLLGTRPAILHLVNVLLHGTNGWLVARLARSLALGPRAAVFSGFLFISFPASVEAVAWCSGLQDVLMTTAVLAGISIWGEPWPLKGRMLACLFALCVAVATKEAGVVLAVLGLIVWCGRFSWREIVAIATPSAVAAAAYSVWRLWQLPLPDGYAQFPTRFIAKELLARSFGGLSVPYHTDLAAFGVALALASGIAIPLLIATNALIWRDDREAFQRFLRAALFVVIAVVPVYRYFHMASNLEGSRYFYLPSAGGAILLVTLAATGSTRIRVNRTAQATVGVLVIMVWATVVRIHLIPWVEASVLRDETIRAATIALASGGCGPGSSFQDVPDSVRGAYVFRNGFPEALAEHVPLTGTPCDLHWIDGSFVSR